MEDKYIRNSFQFFIGIFVSVFLYSCANIASPNGGPYDEKPPKFISSIPLKNQINYQGKKVEIVFDELIQIDKPLENVIITPPQMEQPIVRAMGKKAVVKLLDSLKENTTYTIDFTSSIADNNEKNVLENFSIAFSTGETIDTMEVSGIVLNAENLEPMPGITIGIHSNLEDSAFTKIPFLRTSRTNDRGQFTIRNMAPGKYRIYALEDIMRSYKYSQPGQQIAFCDSLIVPSLELTTRQDTTWKDSLTIDTIKTVPYTHYYPDNIELRLFKEKVVKQYMLKPDRSDQKILTLRFNAPIDSIPDPKPLNFTPTDSCWYYIQSMDEGKTLNYWLLDSLIWQQDTLEVAVDYLKSDSLNILRPKRDTVTFTFRRRPVEKKKKKKAEVEPISFLAISINPAGSVNLYDTMSVTFSEPVLDLTKEHFYLDQKVDTLWNEVDFEFFPDSVNSLKYYIKRPWKYGEEYRLEIDSARIHSAYGKWNDFLSTEFKIRKEDEYGHLYINIIGLDSTATYVELLNTSDSPVRKAKVKNGGVLFMDLHPDKYYARLVKDVNENGRWDTGKYEEKRQPETVYYYPKFFKIMQNWQVEETWDLTLTPLKKQKPMDITKNKPKVLTKKKRDYRNDGRKSSRKSSGMGGFGGMGGGMGSMGGGMRF